MPRVIFHIDMDSYFASVEQQANQCLRGKPIVVSGKEGSRSVIVAASREAKKFGVKTAMLPSEARRLCPGLIFVEGDAEKYAYVSREFVRIFKKFSGRIEVYSIDEAFLDLTGYCRANGDALRVAAEIKKELSLSVGLQITCSIGIAENKLLAKLASEIKKPNGVFLIDENNKEDVLRQIKLIDFCGLGPRIAVRLEKLGVNSVLKLRECPRSVLIQEFGEWQGNRLKDFSFGRDESAVVADWETPAPKSVGRAYTLARNTLDKQEILAVLAHLCEKICRELRRKNICAKTIIVYLRYFDFTHIGFRQTFQTGINNGALLFKIARTKLQAFPLAKPVRLVGAQASSFCESGHQLSLWDEDRRRQNLLPALDKINDIYGELTIKPAFLLRQSRLRKKVNGFRPIA